MSQLALLMRLPDAVQVRMAIRRPRRAIGGGLLAGNRRHNERNGNGPKGRCSDSEHTTKSEFHRLIPLQARTIRHMIRCQGGRCLRYRGSKVRKVRRFDGSIMTGTPRPIDLRPRTLTCQQIFNFANDMRPSVFAIDVVQPLAAELARDLAMRRADTRARARTRRSCGSRARRWRAAPAP